MSKLKMFKFNAGNQVAQEPVLSRKNSKPFLRQELEADKIPNINNNEQSWVSITGVTDNVPPEKLIDNNEFYTQDALKNINNAYNTPSHKAIMQNKVTDDLYKTVASIDENEYLLFIDGVPVCAGSILDVQEQAEKFISGTHELSLNQPIDIESLMVIKKVKINFGLFLES